jgi:hypothetical protein
VLQFVRDLDHLTGLKVAIRSTPSGYYLVGPNGENVSIGDKGPFTLLSPRDQEYICENLGFDASLLGLTPLWD